MLRTRLDCFQTNLVLQAANVPEPRCARRTGKAVCCGRSRAQTQRIFRRGPKDDGVGNPCKCRVAVFLRPRGAKEPGEQRTKSHEQNQDDSSKRAVCACSLDLRLPSHLPAALPAARTRCRPERPRISTCLLRRNFRQGSRFGGPRGTARISGGKGLHFLRAILCVWILAE